MSEARGAHITGVVCRWPGLGLALWALATGLILFRVPSLLTDPRLCFEEGTVYFWHAWHLPAMEALLMPHFDYLAFVPNAACVLAAHLLPLEKAPLLTTLVGMLMQAIVVGLVIHGRARLFESPWRRALAMLIVLFAAALPYLWATSLAAQYLLAMAALLILIEPTPERGDRVRLVAYTGVLLLAGLTGLLSLVFLPIFALQARRERNRRRWLLVGALVIGAVVQAGQLCVRSTQVDSTWQKRAVPADFETISTICTSRMLVAPLAGRPAATAVAIWFQEHRTRTVALWFGVAGTVLLGTLLTLLARSSPHGSCLTWGILLSLLVVFIGAIGDKSDLVTPRVRNFRYFTLPTVALSLLALSRLEARRGVVPVLAAALVAATLIHGIGWYLAPEDLTEDLSWGEGVRAWRAAKQNFSSAWPCLFVTLDRPQGRILFQELGSGSTSDGREPDLAIFVVPERSGKRAKLVIRSPGGGIVHVFLHRGWPEASWQHQAAPGCTLYVPADSESVKLSIPASGELSYELGPLSSTPGWFAVQAYLAGDDVQVSRALLVRVAPTPVSGGGEP